MRYILSVDAAGCGRADYGSGRADCGFGTGGGDCDVCRRSGWRRRRGSLRERLRLSGFRMIEGKLRHRFGDLDLVLDDAGH